MEILCLITALLGICFGITQAFENSDLRDQITDLTITLQGTQTEKLNQASHLNAEIRALEELVAISQESDPPSVGVIRLVKDSI